VQSVIRVSSYDSKKSTGGDQKFRLEESLGKTGNHVNRSAGSALSYDYGPSYDQIHLLNGEALHNLGYRGQGKVIAVLDAGFNGADTNHVFDSLRANNQILGTRDFVTPGGNVYIAHPHGAEVLSTMGGDIPGQLIGTAPKASYWLIRTEDAATENIVEEYNWVVGAEMADSVGADVINSSLGYTTFDNGWMDHSCADMNGHTNPSSIGANIAASRGMALSISAGNEGGSSWTCVSSPSDALEALSIAATDQYGNYAGFSSPGTVNGSYVKPNIASMGLNCYVAYPDGSFGYGSGTSFASPINAGMVACLWQARSNFDQYTLRRVIEESASQYSHPDSLLGYGIPNYLNALTISQVGVLNKSKTQAYPNPFTDEFTVSIDNPITGALEISIISITGNIVIKTSRTIVAGEGNTFTLKNLTTLTPGMYILKISTGSNTEYQHVVKIEK
jgi:hypothetical protein